MLTGGSVSLLSMLLAALDSTIVATALPTITGELGSPERLSWVVTAYLLAQLAARYAVPSKRLDEALATLRARGYVEGDPDRRILTLTPAGCEAQDRLIAARRERLTALAREWPAGHREQLADALQRLARECRREPRSFLPSTFYLDTQSPRLSALLD